jgi:hypothetical protein
VGRGSWEPLLARLFSAMAACYTLPEDFMLGRLVPLPKGGLEPCPGYSRPITLLNTNYELLRVSWLLALDMYSTFVLGHIRLRFYRSGRLGTALLRLLGSTQAAEQLPGAGDVGHCQDL